MAKLDRAVSNGLPEGVDYSLKVLLIGPSGVGKTSLMGRFCSGTFDDRVSTTIGVDFAVKKLKVYNDVVKVNIWDTAGQEKFRTLTSTFYRNAKGVILVFDVTRRSTLEELREYWFSELERYHGSDAAEPIKMVVANKVDMNEAREVSWQEGADFARERGCLFVETSAKANVAVSTAFEELVLKIIETPALIADSETTAAVNVNAIHAANNLAVCYC